MYGLLLFLFSVSLQRQHWQQLCHLLSGKSSQTRCSYPSLQNNTPLLSGEINTEVSKLTVSPGRASQLTISSEQSTKLLSTKAEEQMLPYQLTLYARMMGFEEHVINLALQRLVFILSSFKKL